MNEEEILKKVGAKLKELRIGKNVKQKELSEKSGLSMFSISQMETGHNTSLLSLVQVLKALDRMDMLEPFIEDSEENKEVLDKMDLQHPIKKRVTSPRPYIFDEVENFQMAADESEIEWNTKK